MKPSDIFIALMQIEYPDNLGYIARVMKNFDLHNLILIDPKVKKDNFNAIMKAKFAKEILDKAIILKDFSELRKNFDYIVGTTAALGTDYNIPRLPLTPSVLADKLKETKGKVCILFGRDGSGLTNKEIRQCDFVVTIPTSRKYKTLNIAHSAAIIFYELSKNLISENILSHIKPISQKEKDVILMLVNKAIDNMSFTTEEKKQTQRELWNRIIGKAMLTKREAFALIGFLRKIK